MKSFDPTKCKIDIVHEKGPLWCPGSFYHSELEAGEVTHTVALANLLVDTLAEDGGYDWEKYMARYLNFWRTPGQNSDTYIEIVHRHFFERLADGTPLHSCGMDESCLSGFAVVMPLVLALHACNDVAEANAAIEAHLRLTHNSDVLADEATYMAGVLRALLRGEEPLGVIAEAFDRFYEPRAGQPVRSVVELAKLETEELFVGSDPYARAGEPGCAVFSLR